MAELTLVIAKRNYSSWSLGPRLFLKHAGVALREICIGLDQPDTRSTRARYSRSGRVPLLIDGDLTVWDLLAICEYLNDKRAGANGWPADGAVRVDIAPVLDLWHSCRARCAATGP